MEVNWFLVISKSSLNLDLLEPEVGRLSCNTIRYTFYGFMFRLVNMLSKTEIICLSCWKCMVKTKE